ncbi:MAG TPA: hypothetical protein VEW74_07855 [Candidatus Nitrosotalea sp.]|nr:hypothetical protein [Candidatus Nitrosotalea sp.]
MERHRHEIDELHDKLSAMAHCDKAKLSKAVEKLKAAHATFEDDAQECVVH